jgi:hypothetical protein
VRNRVGPDANGTEMARWDDELSLLFTNCFQQPADLHVGFPTRVLDLTLKVVECRLLVDSKVGYALVEASADYDRHERGPRQPVSAMRRAA